MATELEQTLKQEQETMGVEGSTAFNNLLSSLPDSLSVEDTTDTDDEKADQGKGTEPPKSEVVPVVKTAEELEVEAEENRQKEIAEQLEEERKKGNPPQKEENNTDGESYISQAREFLGLEDDEDEEDETVEGILNVAKKAVERAVAKTKEEGPTELYEKMPVVKNLVQHLEAGGSILSFQRQQQVQDFSKFEIKEDDLVGQEQMYRASLQAKGMDEDEIEDTINLAKDKGVLHERSQKGKDYLVKQQSAMVQAEIDKEKAVRDSEIKEEQAAEAEVKKILASGKILGMPITKEEATSLEKWGLARNAKGQTERELAWANLSVEKMLILDKIIFNDFKGLGIKVKTTNSTPLADLKKKAPVKTVNMQTSSGGSIGSQLGITNAKQLFGGGE